jgi:hypothetical protein
MIIVLDEHSNMSIGNEFAMFTPPDAQSKTVDMRSIIHGRSPIHDPSCPSPHENSARSLTAIPPSMIPSLLRLFDFSRIFSFGEGSLPFPE